MADPSAATKHERILISASWKFFYIKFTRYLTGIFIVNSTDIIKSMGSLLERARGNHELSKEQEVLLASFLHAERIKIKGLGLAVSWLKSGKNIPNAKKPLILRTLHGVVIKPMGDTCNLRCSYCYQNRYGRRCSQALMKESILEEIIRQVLDNGQGRVEFIWLGGEPLMAGIDFFRQAVQYQKKHNIHQRSILNIIQTNAVMLSAEWVNFFLDEGFSVSVSLDGPEDIHNTHRLDTNGRGTHSQVVAAVELMQSNGIFPSMVSTVTDLVQKRTKKIFKWVSDSGIEKWRLTPFFGLDRKGGLQAVRADVYADFMIELFDLWLASGRKEWRIALFDDIVMGLLGAKPTTCSYSGKCGSYLTIDANGSVFPCSRPSQFKLLNFGNVGQISLDNILYSKDVVKFEKNVATPQNQCKKCPFYHMCYNGCTLRRINISGQLDIKGRYYFCESYGRICSHIRARIYDVAAIR